MWGAVGKGAAGLRSPEDRVARDMNVQVTEGTSDGSETREAGPDVPDGVRPFLTGAMILLQTIAGSAARERGLACAMETRRKTELKSRVSVKEQIPTSPRKGDASPAPVVRTPFIPIRTPLAKLHHARRDQKAAENSPSVGSMSI